ncbi:carbohydrate binding domain-containing protein [Streptomyces alboflavus]|uniref:carbohydrate binding domain-containing protein n=1 Tax=Streptomyces alboflavus TaxID=67267 RepID=UPI0012FEF08F|nr:carbohydrate binding domain-containing protein [Streptomyces alboflavus]
MALDLPGAAGDYASTPDAAALDITGDIDVRVDATLANWVLPEYPSTGDTDYGYTELIGKETTADRAWALYTRLGKLLFQWRNSGGSATSVISDDLPLTASGRLAVRVALDVDNGASGYDLTFYTSDSIDGTWTQLGDTTTGGATTSIRASAAALRIGDVESASSAWHHPAIGRVHAVQVLDGIGGTAVANPDFTAHSDGTTSFADAAGRTWSLAGNAEITNRKVRFVGEVSSWTPRWDTGGLDVVTEVEAAGVLRRLGQGAVPLKSPVFRAYTGTTATDVVAYWPMEDEENATELASAFDGHPAVTFTDTVSVAGYSDYVGSAPVPTVTSGQLQVSVPEYSLDSTSNTNILFFVKVPAAGVVSTQRLLWFSQSGSATYWDVQVNTSGNVKLRAFDNEGTNILDSGFSSSSINGLEKIITVELVKDGADVDWVVTVYDIAGSLTTAVPSDTLSFFTLSGTLASYTTGRVTRFRMCRDGAMNGTAVGHLVLGNTTDAFKATAGALVGWTAETAASRVSRLGREEGIHAYATRSGDEQCGAQARNTALDLMRSAESVDEGILAEQRGILGVRYVTRASMYNQPVDLSLDYTGSDGLVAPLAPVDDDQSVTNDVTVQREGGSSARAVLDAGALSTQAPPDGVGLYDTSYALNLLDDTQPAHHAGWRLHLGTWDETRFPQATVNLANAPASIEAAAVVDVGSRLQITNPPVWLPPDTLDLLVQGYSEVMDQFTWTITYNCTPFGPFSVATEGDARYARADTAGSELDEALTTTETDVDVATTSGPVWVESGDRLTANPDFEVDTSGWTAGGGATISRVATPENAPFSGSWSLKIVPDGVSSSAYAVSDQVAVSPSTSYYVYGWLRCDTSRSVTLGVDWFTGGGAYISSSSVSQSVAAGVWTEFSGTVTSPGTAGLANLYPQVGSTPSASDVVHADVVLLSDTEESGSRELPFEVRVAGEVMLVRDVASWATDAFGRSVSSGWGTADSGQAWTTSGGTAADYAVGSGYGSHVLASTNVSRRCITDFAYADIDVYVSLTTSATAAGGSLYGGLTGRYTDSDNLYMARVEATTSDTLILSIRKRVAAAETQLGTYALSTGITYTPGTTYVRVRFQVAGSMLRAKAWLVGALEPGPWQVEVVDTSLTTSASIGTRSIASSANTNINPEVRYDDYEVVNPQTFTVTRSVNGVTKAQSAGADVRLAYPAYAAL